MLASISNLPLVLLAVLGWLVSLYFGFFRYRQYVWSRNKVRYDLFLKLDQRRAELSSKFLLLAELDNSGKDTEARMRSLLRRYWQLLLQVDYFRSEDALDDQMTARLELAAAEDLRQMITVGDAFHALLKQWLSNRSDTATFTANLINQLTPV